MDSSTSGEKRAQSAARENSDLRHFGLRCFDTRNLEPSSPDNRGRFAGSQVMRGTGMADNAMNSKPGLEAETR